MRDHNSPTTMGPASARTAAWESLERKLQRDRTALLEEDEVSLIASELRAAVAASFPCVPSEMVEGIEDLVRWRQLGVRCRQARTERGWSYRDASAATGIPQYRVKAIEEGRLLEVKPDLARRYFAALRVGDWVARWARANEKLAARVLGGLASRQGPGSRARRT